MVNNIEFTFLSDGTSDKMLISPINWLLRLKFPECPINVNFADLRQVLQGKESLSDKICLAIELFPCRVLIIHRDTENKTYEFRKQEIEKAIEKAICNDKIPEVVLVIPSKMSEAWMLIDANAIRNAAGNPNGKVQLNLPELNKLERISDPKSELLKLLKTATELTPRRLKKFNSHSAILRLAECIEDFSALRSLESFRCLERDIDELRSIFFNY